MSEAAAVTGAEAGLGGDAQIRIALQAIADHDGMATMQQIYDAVNAHLDGNYLSEQGKASLRRLVNKVATDAGYIYKFDQDNPGWRITPEGRDLINEPESSTEEVINVDTRQPKLLSNTARGDAFELYILEFLKKMHPYYTWYHQGRRKNNERGLDFIGYRVGDHSAEEPRTLGVQVKFHPENIAPKEFDWLKFLAGCFSRRVDSAIFITTGRLTSEQRREAGEARITVIEGRVEITRLTLLFGLQPFDLFDLEDEMV